MLTFEVGDLVWVKVIVGEDRKGVVLRKPNMRDTYLVTYETAHGELKGEVLVGALRRRV